MEEWLIENKDWFVPFATLLCAAFGGWWAGRKRIGIEVLSKNRQEWIKEVRLCTSKIDSFVASFYLEFTHEHTKDIEISFDFFPKKTKEMYDLMTYLKLLLNPNEDKSKKVIDCLNIISSEINNCYGLTPALFGADNDQNKIIEQIRNANIESKKMTYLISDILKEEWEKVKKGK
ncbi:hypothetical protein [Orbus mooreae]|uniref:hypothetical protein n=1 Tax=Orbus mooreae TaxID=3074107 RepID=UPI00370D383D